MMYRPSHNTFYTKALFNLGHGRIKQETMPDLTSPKTQGFRSDLLWDRTSVEGDAKSLIGLCLGKKTEPVGNKQTNFHAYKT